MTFGQVNDDDDDDDDDDLWQAFLEVLSECFVIEECQFHFNFSAVSDQIAKRAQKFLVKYENSGNTLCTAVRPTW